MNKVLIALGIIAVCIAIRYTMDVFDTPAVVNDQPSYKIENVSFSGSSLFPPKATIATTVLKSDKVILNNQRNIRVQTLDNGIMKFRSNVEGPLISVFDNLEYLVNVSPNGVLIKNMEMVSKTLDSNLEELNFENYGVIDQIEVDGLENVESGFQKAVDILIRDPAFIALSSYYDQNFEYNSMKEMEQSFRVDSSYNYTKKYQWLDNTDSTNIHFVCDNYIDNKHFRSDSLWYDLTTDSPLKIHSISTINDSIDISRITTY